MSEKVNIKINGKNYLVDEGTNILSFCQSTGIDIPALCYNEVLKPYGACRLCIVDVKGGNVRPGITTSCTLKATEGMEIISENEEINNHRKILFQFYLAQAPDSQTIKEMAARYNVTNTPFTSKRKENDNLGNQCILCGQCVRVCTDIIEKGVISYIGRGYYVRINTAYGLPSDICMGCKACAEVCPTGAIRFEDIEDTRYMHSWSETKIPLKKCEACGEYYSPAPFDDKIMSETDPAAEKTLQSLCPLCRRKLHSKKQVAISENKFDILNLK